MTQKAVVSFVAAIAASFYFAIWSAMAATSTPVLSPVPVENTAQPMESVASSASSLQVEYTLPYPGILPNHPLYRIKLVRDRVLDFLIRDPLKRIDYNVLMADKRLNMGISLVGGNNYQLAEETVSKAEKYFVRAVDELAIAKNNGRTVPVELMDKLRKSIQVHEYTVTNFIKNSPEEYKNGFESTRELIRQTRSRIDTFGN